MRLAAGLFSRALALAATLLGAAPACAQGLQDENLIQSYPKGFAIGWSKSDGNVTMVEAVAAPETVESWTRLITTQIFHDAGRIPPAVLADRIMAGFAQGCPGAQASGFAVAVDNGYPVGSFAIHCARNPATGLPETVLFRSIRGRDALYLVQYAYRLPPTAEEDARIAAYLATITACDTRDKGHLCPPLTPVR